MNSQLEKISQIIQESNEPIQADLQNDILILRTKKNQLYLGLSLIGILLSILLFIYHNKTSYNLKLGFVIFILSFAQLLSKQSINKCVIFNAINNTVTITPSFFLHKLIAKFIFKSTSPFKSKDFPKMNIGYGFKNNQSYYTLYIKNNMSWITLFEFENKETAQKLLEEINKLH